jgi:hypothetical protein
MITQNFDVMGGVVNGCVGKLVSVRYQVGDDGRRHALSCVVEAPDTTLGIMEELPDYHVVSLRDTTDIVFKHPHSGASVLVKRTQVPILPAFAMTAHKAQGKTLPACVVNFTGCHGTESPYVMVSRATSLEGLVILTPFSKDKICCRRSQDVRDEFRRLRYLALQTVTCHGTEAEAASARSTLKAEYGRTGRQEIDVDAPASDAADRVQQLQRENAAIHAHVNQRFGWVAVDTPIASTSGSSTSDSAPGSLRLTKRKLDDATILPSTSPAKRRNLQAS